MSQISVESDYKFAVLPEWVLYSDVSAQAVRLYAVLARKADNESGESYYSRRKLAAFLGAKDARVVDKAVAELESIGAVSVIRGRISDDGDPTSNLYRIHTIPAGGVVHENVLPSAKQSTRGGAFSCTTGGTSKRTLSDTQLDLRANRSEKKDRFSEFWDAFADKRSAKKAKEAWDKIPPNADFDQIIEAARAYRQWINNHPNAPVTKMAQGWLNDRRWEDELPPYPVQGSKRVIEAQAMHERYALEDRRMSFGELGA